MLKVSHSNLLDRLHDHQKGRSPRYNKQDDDRHLPFIRELCDARVANGYRRITARRSRLLAANDERLNHKRVYRLMKQDGLLLPRHTGRPQERCHNGQVITLKPDLRWCSDGIEIRCWNKVIVRVAFTWIAVIAS